MKKSKAAKKIKITFSKKIGLDNLWKDAPWPVLVAQLNRSLLGDPKQTDPTRFTQRPKF